LIFYTSKWFIFSVYSDVLVNQNSLQKWFLFPSKSKNSIEVLKDCKTFIAIIDPKIIRNFPPIDEIRGKLLTGECFARMRTSGSSSDVWTLFEETAYTDTQEFTGIVRCKSCSFMTRYHGQITGLAIHYYSFYYSNIFINRHFTHETTSLLYVRISRSIFNSKGQKNSKR
jgi:hypothetical protein